MSLKTILATLILSGLPALTFAQGCENGTGEQQAMSCAEGSQWDQATATCVPVTTS